MGDEYGQNTFNYDGDATDQTAGATWKPIDLEPYLIGAANRPEPTIGLARSDGLKLLYTGLEHSGIGEMESGKSWFAIACAVAEITQGNGAIYIHFEEGDPGDTVERLQALGLPDASILENFRFIGPNEPVDPYALAALLVPPPSLVVLDGVNEAMSLHGWKIMEPSGYADYRRHLVKPCTAVGAAVLSLDHVVKDQEKQGRNALGSVHKGAGLTGSMIKLANAAPFGRGQRGVSHVFVTKDRPGWLRRHGRPDKRTPGKTYVGTLVVDDTRTRVNYLDLAFIEPQDRGEDDATAKPLHEQDDEYVRDVVQAITKDGKPATLRDVRAKATGIGRERIDNALARLVLDGQVHEEQGPKRSRLFTVAERSRELDEQ